MPNQNPEQLARDRIDSELIRSGWGIQHKNQINLYASTGIATRENQTGIGTVGYVLFVNKQLAGIIKAKRAEEGMHHTTHEDQTEGYRIAKLKYFNDQPLFFGYEGAGDVTRFTCFRDSKQRSSTVYSGMLPIAPKLDNAFVNQHACLYHPKNDFSKRYLGYWIIAKTGDADYLNKNQKGTAKAGLNLGDLKHFRFHIVPSKRKIISFRKSKAASA